MNEKMMLLLSIKLMGMIKDVVNIAMMIIITIKTQLSGDNSKNVTVDLIQILIIRTIKVRRSLSCGSLLS